MSWFQPGWLEALLDAAENRALARDRAEAVEEAVIRAVSRSVGVSVYRGDLDGNRWAVLPDPTVPAGLIVDRPGLPNIYPVPAIIEGQPHTGASADAPGKPDNGSV